MILSYKDFIFVSISLTHSEGRWRNETTVHGYIQEGQRFESNAATNILENLSSGLGIENMSRII